MRRQAVKKPPPKWGSVHRDKNPGNEWSEIPAETHYFSSCRKRAVCKDWMVEVVGHKLKTHHPVIEPVSDIRAGNVNFFDAETEGPDPPFCLAETDAGTRTNSKKARCSRDKCAYHPRSSIPEDWVVGAPGLEPGTR